MEGALGHQPPQLLQEGETGKFEARKAFRLLLPTLKNQLRFDHTPLTGVGTRASQVRSGSPDRLP